MGPHGASFLGSLGCQGTVGDSTHAHFQMVPQPLSLVSVGGVGRCPKGSFSYLLCKMRALSAVKFG